MEKTEIFCPLCRWRPKADSRWSCSRTLGGCGNLWNTFDTRGVCPECNWHWIITACHACKQYSQHEDWYHEPDEPPARVNEREEETADV